MPSVERVVGEAEPAVRSVAIDSSALACRKIQVDNSTTVRIETFTENLDIGVGGKLRYCRTSIAQNADGIVESSQIRDVESPSICARQIAREVSRKR